MRAAGTLVAIVVAASAVACRDDAPAAPPRAVEPGPDDAARAAELARVAATQGAPLVTAADLERVVSGPPVDVWYTIEMVGRRVGWMHYATRPSAADEPGARAVLNESHLELDGGVTEDSELAFFAAAPPYAFVASY